MSLIDILKQNDPQGIFIKPEDGESFLDSFKQFYNEVNGTEDVTQRIIIEGTLMGLIDVYKGLARATRYFKKNDDVQNTDGEEAIKNLFGETFVAYEVLNDLKKSSTIPKPERLNMYIHRLVHPIEYSNEELKVSLTLAKDRLRDLIKGYLPDSKNDS